MSIFKQQREMVKEQILKTAAGLFKEFGYSSVSIEQITKAVGIAKGTFYNFFESKRDILMLWAATQFGSFDFSSAFDPAKTARENLYGVIELMVGGIRVQENLFASFLDELIHGSDRDRSTFDFPAIFSNAVRISADYEKAAEGLDEKIAVLNNALFGAITDWFRLKRPVDGLEAHLKKVIDICLFGILSR